MSSAAPAATAHQVHRARGAGVRRAARLSSRSGTTRSAEMSQSPDGAAANGAEREKAPRYLKRMRPADVAALVERDPRLIVPVGTCEQHGPHLPIGADT